MSQDDRTDEYLVGPLEMCSCGSKGTLDIPKSVFNAFRRKLSLGAPAGSHVGYDLSIESFKKLR